MAYDYRSRDPLLDSSMQAAIERRGKELIGVMLIAMGLMAAAMIASYTPEDPNWMVSTDAPVQNWMGRIGASIAAPLFMIVGWGAWSIPLILLAWGLRLALHQGEDRALGRLIFAPIAVVLSAIYAATLVPGDGWTATHSFGLGGLFGDTVMGAVLTAAPMTSHTAVKLSSLGLGVAMTATLCFVLGFTWPEMKRLFWFGVVGVIMTYAHVTRAAGQGAVGVMAMSQEVRARRAERTERARLDAEQLIIEPEVIQHLNAQTVAEPVVPKPSLLARMPAFIKRPEPMPEPELIEPQPRTQIDEMPGEERIRAKIADVIKQRVRQNSVAQDLPLTKGRGRRPDPLVLDTTPRSGLPPEPPVTAKRAADAFPPLAPTTSQPATARSRGPAPAAHAVQNAAPNPAPRAVQPQPTVVVQSGTDPVVPKAAPMVEDAQEPDTVISQVMARMAVPPRATEAAAAAVMPRNVVQNPIRKPAAPSRRAQAEAQPALAFDDEMSGYELPPLGLLASPDLTERHHLSDDALAENARMLENVLDDYGVKGEIVSVRPGPVVTMYELEPAPGLKASRVIGLADDIARSMSALSARVSTVPGRSVIGIELPNNDIEKVMLREILASRDFGDSTMRLPLALGKDIGGGSVVANLAKMPHLLIAGTTGSGKSVAINTMILSLLYKLTPDECRLIMIDPKMLELSVYDGIPHLLSPVVTDPKKAVVALKWVVGEMEERYRKMSKMGVRNIEGYNGRVREALEKGELFSRTVQTGFDEDTGEPLFETEESTPEILPFIVVIVDEMADLMMVAGKEIEACIQRLAQMARASGIHLIMATQRPSVDVITGTIKANFPTRISFQVTSKIDSRTILGEMGAEQLLGMGDMLYMAGGSKIMRCHGPFVSDQEVEEIVNHLKAFGPPSYVGTVLDGPSEDRESDIDAVLGLGGNTDGEDALYDTAVQIVIKDRKCSTSYIQRKLAIGYNKAARLVEQMEDEGLVSPANHVGKREILVPEQQ
ncbi:MAG: DNA translocase FtsK 4TM domain-containing protein [Rhodobacteraceae bacterium]|nr:DNA translocase FtsK 4TM domain-containing protein [Paracoccaceae bacterium]